MCERFQSVFQYPFTTTEDLDRISISPHVLQGDIRLSRTTRDIVSAFGIDRKLKVHYICHWKNVLITQQLIKSSSLTYQEDEALIDTILHYPNPVSDWSIYDTLSIFCLKFVAGVGESGLNLFRGITKQRLNNIGNHDLQKMLSEMNHPGPCLSTLQDIMPKIIHANKTKYRKESIFHLTS